MNAGSRLAPERGEAGRVPGFEQVGLPRPLHERVAPVEEDRLEHAPGTATRALTRRILWALARPRARHDRASTSSRTPDETTAVRARVRCAHPARVADRRGDGARGRAHRPRHRRLPERELRQRAGADHRAPRGEQRPAAGRPRLARRHRHLEPAARLRRRAGRRPERRTHRPALAAHAARPLRASPSCVLLPVSSSATRAIPSGTLRWSSRFRSRSCCSSLYLAVTFRNLRSIAQAERDDAAAGAWSLTRSLAALARRDGR